MSGRDSIHEDLVLAAGDMLARVRAGGGAREQLRKAYLAATRRMQLEELREAPAAVPAAGAEPHRDARDPAQALPEAPPLEFAPPEAEPAGERILPDEAASAETPLRSPRLPYRDD